MRRIRWWWLAGPLALTFAAAAAWRLPSRDAAVPTMRLVRAPFVHEVAAEGVLKARQATAIQAPAEAARPMRVSWLLADGTRVRAGDLLASLDGSEWTQALADARGGYSDVEWRQAKQRAAAAAGAHDLERDAQLARSELEAASRFAATDEVVFSRHQRIESAIDGELAAVRESTARRVLETQARVVASDDRLLALEREKWNLEISRAEQGLSSLAIRSPHDGIFSLRTDWRGNSTRQGDTLWPGQAFAEIPDLAVLDAEVWVLEADAGGLSVGQSATVVREAASARSLEAKVTRVDAVAKPRQRGVPVQYFGATLAMQATDGERMHPGERVRARIRLAEVDSALAVPRQAIVEREGRRVVFRRRDLPFGRSDFETVPVEIGAQGLGVVVVTAGLGEGDEIALCDPGAPARLRGSTGPDGATPGAGGLRLPGGGG